MKVITEIKIEKNINEVWEVMGNQFGEVHLWSSNFLDSKPGGNPKFFGLDYTFRDTITERGNTVQVLESFDPRNYTLSYFISEGKPEIAKSASSTWSLRTISSDLTKVILEFNMEPKVSLNEYMTAKIEAGLAASANQIAVELKHYLENGEPHPGKLKQLSQTT